MPNLPAVLDDPSFRLFAPFPLVIGLLFVTYKLLKRGQKKSPVVWTLTVDFMALLLLFLLVWPIAAAVILFNRHEYLLGLFPVIYATPYCLVLALLFKPILDYIRLINTRGEEEARARMKALVERFQRDAPTDDELIAAGSLLGSLCQRIADALHSMFVLPLAFLKV